MRATRAEYERLSKAAIKISLQRAYKNDPHSPYLTGPEVGRRIAAWLRAQNASDTR